MRLYYGGYAHDDNEVVISVSVSVEESESGQPLVETHVWNVQGQVQAASQSALYIRLAALDVAYSRWFRDFRLIDSNNVVVRSLLNAGSISGVKIRQKPTWPTAGGAELSTFATYTLVAEASYPASSGSPLRSFQETLRLGGGGPRKTVVECVNVPGQPQTLYSHTNYRAIQSGSAVGYLDYPVVPTPLFPAWQVEAPEITYGSPRFYGKRFIDWPVSWSYQFVSPEPLLGKPNRFPVG